MFLVPEPLSTPDIVSELALKVAVDALLSIKLPFGLSEDNLDEFRVRPSAFILFLEGLDGCRETPHSEILLLAIFTGTLLLVISPM